MLGDIYCHIVEFDSNLIIEASNWCHDNNVNCFPGVTRTKGRATIRFREASDAMMFKLVFGG